MTTYEKILQAVRYAQQKTGLPCPPSWLGKWKPKEKDQ